MACGNNEHNPCVKSGSSACTDENLAYFTSQEMTIKYIANLQISELTTANKTLLGALLEINKALDLKQDKNPTLDHLSTLTIDQVNAMIISGTKLL